MRIVLDLSPEVEARLKAEADAKGIELLDLAGKVIAEHAFEPGARKRIPEEKRRRLLEIVEQVRSLPTLDSRSSDDLVGFDENGLPYR